jgi:maltooligosyltrehalose trehalohydrolase
MATENRLGASLTDEGAAFRVWAPRAEAVSVVLEGPVQGGHALRREADGYFSGQVSGVHAGQLYRYRIGDGPPFPDVASRFQPQGVHGPSQVIDLSRFPWSDAGWQGIERDRLIIYELHVGTFSPEETYDGVIQRLPLLRDLGINAIELMPLADFPGSRNWGYDGVSPYAPARCYGTPADLQRLVDAAHQLGVAVILDVVYNHLGPDGNYTGVYSPYYRTKAHQTPWGDAHNFDGPNSRPVRDYFLHNALHWLGHYHFDGLRLDATHAILDDSRQHFLAELAEKVHAAFPQRKIVLFAEDNQNLNTMLRPADKGGWGLDGIWADDFHHELRRLLAGDHESYFRDYKGRVEDLATILNQGWLFTGQHSIHQGGPRGTDPSGLTPSQFVICIQNHDQIGNRALGHRLHNDIDLAAYRAASALLLTAPQTPLLFMGQEWAATAPFCFFTDHNAELGRLVTEGRRQEFGQFKTFSDPAVRESIPDPQAEETLRKSRLNWGEREAAPHREILALYQALLALRKNEPALRNRESWEARAWDDDTLVVRHQGKDGSVLILVVRLRGAGVFQSYGHAESRLFAGRDDWQVLLHTEERRFALQAKPLTVQHRQAEVEIDFPGPAAVVLRGV